MEIQELIRNHDYIQQFKKHKVVYRNYPKLNLMIVKRKYGTTYCPDNPLVKQLSWFSDKL